MASARLSSYFLLQLYIVLYFLTSVYAEEDPNDRCPGHLSWAATVYSPFVPWWAHYSGDNGLCWSWAICIYLQADEARKQQFHATALLMGLFPPMFKDIAWPGRRIILLSEPLNVFLEVVVRGLGMEPKWLTEQEQGKEDVVWAWWLRSDLARMTWGWAQIACGVAAVGVMCSGGALLMMELYSKRSALGCDNPGWVLSWFAFGFLPAIAHTFFSRMRKQHEKRKAKSLFRDGVVVEGQKVTTIISAVQGAEEWWIVQLIWAMYYGAGTLIVRP